MLYNSNDYSNEEDEAVEEEEDENEEEEDVVKEEEVDLKEGREQDDATGKMPSILKSVDCAGC
jgi:hypothetical protein